LPIRYSVSAALLPLATALLVLPACGGDPVQPASAGAHRSSPADVGPDLATDTTGPVDTGSADTAVVDTSPPDRILREGVQGVVTTVIDGDTIHVTVDGWYHRVRLQGINAPECDKSFVESPEGSSYVCTSDDEYWGLASYQALRDLALGATVTVYCDQLPGQACPTDPYDRFLAFVETDDVDLGEYMARNGHAFSYTAFYSTRRATYCVAEDLAIEENLGMWALGDRDTVLSRMSASTRDWYQYRDERCAEALE
jgi:endonuclease YncB( thermonuclease family)